MTSQKKNISNSEPIIAPVKENKLFWQHIAMFLVVLTLSLPIYSSSALAASMSITHNAGNDNIQSFLDAESDTWTLQVELGNLEEDMAVDPSQVVLDVSGSEIPFQSCSGDSISTTCEFQSVLTDGITESEYPFTVRLYDLIIDEEDETATEFGSELASDTDSITADASEPSISFNDIDQEGSDLILDFTVTDNPTGLCVGLKEVEVIDADSGEILETIDFEEQGDCSFDYNSDTGNAGVLQSTLSGEGKRNIKIRATDYLGHEKTSSAKAIDTDFVAPTVQTSTLLIEDFGDYIGNFKQSSDVYINITECEDLETVVATSEQIEFYSQPATCSLEDSASCSWECSWQDLYITPSGTSVSATVTAIDEFDNEVTTTASASFQTDTTAPQLLYFGTKYLYDGLSYVEQGQATTFYAYISESGAGVSEDTIKANLFAVGGSETNTPTSCEEDRSGVADYLCIWEISNVGGDRDTTSSREITLSVFNDLVGNVGDAESFPVIIDGVDPIVRDIELYGVSASGQKNFFQSNDDLLIEVEVQEGSGVVAYVNVQDIVMDAYTKYQYGTNNEDGEYEATEWDGWAIFTNEESCQRDEESGMWDCEFNINSIKSGHDGSADIEIIITDTAGNEVNTWPESEKDAQNVAKGEEGDYQIEIYALDEETQPDFWEQSSKTPLPDFINLDSAELTYSRMDYTVGLKSSVGANLALAEISSCTSEELGAPSLSREMLFGGNLAEPDDSPTLHLILEFEPFDGTTIVETDELRGIDSFESKSIDYTCTVKLYSIIDDVAMTHFEEQEIILPIKFGYSSIGALDESVEALISEHVNQAGFKVLNGIAVMSRVLRALQMVTTVLTTLNTLMNIFDAVSATMDTGRWADAITGSAPTNFCLGKQTIEGEIDRNFIQKAHTVISVLYCSPGPAQGTKIGAWQSAVLEWWGVIKGDWLLNKISTGEYYPSKIATTDGISNIDVGSAAGSQEVADFINSQHNPTSLYDNLIVSSVGLCLPGIIYNLEKLQQVHCSKLSCLKNDVTAGLATVSDCDARFRYGICKYIWGELFEIPLFGFVDGLGELLNSVIHDPISLISFALSATCGLSCPTSSVGNAFCNNFFFFSDIFKTIGAVANTVKSIPSIKHDECKANGIDVKAYKDQATDTTESTTSDDVSTTTGTAVSESEVTEVSEEAAEAAET